MKPVPFRERLTCTIAEAEAHTGISRRTLWRRIADGRLATRRSEGYQPRLVIVASLLELVGDFVGQPADRPATR